MPHQSTLPNASIGLNSSNISESNINEAVWKYCAMKNISGGPLEQAPVPKGTVAEANSLRRHILELSIAPDIYANRHLKVKGSSRLG